MKKLLLLFALSVSLLLTPDPCAAQPSVPTAYTISDSGRSLYIIVAPVGYAAVNYYVNKAGASVSLTINDSVVLTGTATNAANGVTKSNVRFSFYKNNLGWATNIGYPLFSATNPFQVYAYLNQLLMTGYGYTTINTAGGTILKHNAGTLNNFTIDSAGTGLAYFGLWDGFDTTGVYLGGFTTLAQAYRLCDYRFKKGLYVKIYGAVPGRISFFFNAPFYKGI